MARRQVSIFINGKEVENQIKAITSAKARLNAELNRMTVGTAEYNKKASELRRVNGILADHRNAINGVEGGWKKLLSSGIGKLGAMAAGAFAVDAIVGYGAELFRLGTEMEVMGKKAATVFGDTLPQVTKAAEDNAAAMGLTTSQYIDAAAAIGDLLIPMGFQREEAANISTNLVNLSGALSEWSGGQVDAEGVTKILSKAMLGEREELKQLGIAISEADVQNRLAEKGLSKLTGEMLQQAKAAATLELITEKSTDAQAAYAANADTSIRKQAELRATLQSIQENIANALIPVFKRLLDAAVPVVDWFGRFVEALTSGDAATEKTSAGMRILMTMLTNVGNVLKLVWGLFKGLGGFLLDNFGGIIEFVTVSFARLQNGLYSVLNGAADLLNIEVKFKAIPIEDVKKAFAEMRKARADSKVDEPVTTAVAGPNSPTRPGAAPPEVPGGDGKKTVDDRIKNLERLRSALDKFREEEEAAALTDDERAQQRVQQRYDKEIALALQLEAQGVREATAARIELEKLRDKELLLLRLDQSQQAFEAEMLLREEQEAERIARELAFQESRDAAIRTIQEVTREVVMEEQALALLQLEEQYAELTELAQQHGLDTLDIEIAARRERERIRREFDERAVKETAAQQAAIAQNYASTFSSMATLIGGAIELVGDKSAAGVRLQKILTLAQIGFNSASAIAAATAAGALAGPFPANLAAIATGVATVLGNIAQARAVFAETPQFAGGGWTNVKGASDGRTYSAKYIGQAPTGMLPAHPTLIDTSIGRVLGSEKGREYFVNNTALKNPMVMNYVRAIDNIVSTRQFAGGGVTTTLPPGAAAGMDMGELTAATTTLTAAVTQLVTILQSPIYARIDDDTIIDIRDQLNKIVTASGGVA